MTDHTGNKTSAGTGLVCGCYLGPSLQDLPRFLRYPGLDMIELRLDTFVGQSLEDAAGALAYLASPSRVPVVATNRPKREGGAFAGAENDRLELLLRAVRAGAEWIDVELGTPTDFMEAVRASGAKVLVSHHDFEKTPTEKELENIAEKMSKTGADAMKIAVTAKSQSDNLRVLGMIPAVRDKYGKDLVAFSMGPLGRWSRLACLFLGSPWTYVQIGEGPAAPGQLTLAELRTSLDILGFNS